MAFFLGLLVAYCVYLVACCVADGLHEYRWITREWAK